MWGHSGVAHGQIAHFSQSKTRSPVRAGYPLVGRAKTSGCNILLPISGHARALAEGTTTTPQTRPGQLRELHLLDGGQFDHVNSRQQ